MPTELEYMSIGGIFCSRNGHRKSRTDVTVPNARWCFCYGARVDMGGHGILDFLGRTRARILNRTRTERMERVKSFKFSEE